MDPALVKYNSMLAVDSIDQSDMQLMQADMFVNKHKYFRWTPRTAWLTIAYVVVVPSIFGYIGYTTDVGSRTCQAIGERLIRVLQGKYSFRGKLRGDTIADF